MTRKEWGTLVALINDLWPERPRDVPWADGWWPMVEPYEFNDLHDALIVYGREPGGAWPPTGAQLVALADDLGELAGGFDEAWKAMLKAVHKVGRDALPDFDDWTLVEVIDMPEWQRFCNTHEDELGVYEGQLRRRYDVARRRRVRRNATRGPRAPRRGLRSADELLGLDEPES